MKRSLNKIAWLLAAALLISASAVANANTSELEDLNADMEEYLNASKHLNQDTDRLFISDMAVQNIYRQWNIWFYSDNRVERMDQLLGSSYTKFVILHYYLNSPSWVEWGMNELETVLPSYEAHIDTTTELSYGEQLHFIETEWMYKFATCNAFNVLVPIKKIMDNPIELKLRQGFLSDEQKYVVRTAERYLNRRLKEEKEFFYFYVPPGEYQVFDQKTYIYPKEFTAGTDTSQFIYLTTNHQFNFVPVVKIFSEDGVTYDTLTPSDFELVRMDEGRIFDFQGLEFGRYLFNVKPPYKIVDRYPNKLIIPKEEFGNNYLDRHSELFDKAAYDQLIIESNKDFVYTNIELLKQAGMSTSGDNDDKKDDKKNKRNR
jgi:hypothetical protein